MKRDIKKLERFMEKLGFLLFWLRGFYPKARGITYIYLLYFFFPQKVLQINGRVPWPVHFTSRVLYHRNISVGEKCAPGMSSCCYVQGRNGIRIGDNLRMGPGVGLISANHRVDDYDEWTLDPPIDIGANVWLGMNAVVMPGVKIGDNVIVGANSVVTSDIPSDVICAGAPCRVIKHKAPYGEKGPV